MGNGVRPPPSTPSAKDSVLLVDDEPLIPAYASMLLRKAGYDVLTAPDAEHAWKLFERRRACLQAVVTDVVMPGAWDGLELVRRVRADAPCLPVVLVTGYELPSAVLDLRCALLLKPFSAYGLRSALARAMELMA
jgi:CheY-like chemotaxis protein